MTFWVTNFSFYNFIEWFVFLSDAILQDAEGSANRHIYAQVEGTNY